MSNFFNIREINHSLFKFINEFFGKNGFDHLMVILSEIFNPQIIIYQSLAITLACLYYLFLIRKNNSFKKQFLLITETLSSFFVSASIILIIVLIIKHYTLVERPFCHLKNIYVIDKIISTSKCNHSFPSGHTTIAVIMIASFWPLFTNFFKFIAVILLILVSISRIVSGAHYPVDIFGAIVIALPLTLYIRNRLNHFINYYNDKYNLFDKFLRHK